MKKNQEAHLAQILKEVTTRINKKYRHGAREHKGDLWEVDLLKEALDEVIDLFVYIQTEIIKRKR